MSGRKSDWRRDGQNEETRRIMKYVGTFLNLAGAVCFFGTLGFGSLDSLWSFACIAVSIVSLVFYLACPQYFSLMATDVFKQRVGNRTKIIHLEMGVEFSALTLLVRSLRDFEFMGWTPLLYYAIAGGAAISLIMYYFSREHRENTDMLVTTVILSIFISGGIAAQVNHIANREPEGLELCTVTDLDYNWSGKRGLDTWYCTVEKKSGAELRLPISRAAYNELELGDEVSIYHGTGALKIEYAYLSNFW